MPDTKISALDAYTTYDADDLVPVVDLSDTAMAASGTTKRATLAQVIAPASRVLWRGLSAGTAVANTSAQTSVFNGIATTIGSRTIAGGTLTAGNILRPTLMFATTVAAGSPTLRWIVSLGGAVVFDFTSVALGQTSAALQSLVGPTTCLQVQSAGAAGKVLGTVSIQTGHGVTFAANCAGGTSSASGSIPYLAPTQVTVDTTAPLTFDVQVKWSAPAAANSIQFLGGSLAIEG